MKKLVTAFAVSLLVAVPPATAGMSWPAWPWSQPKVEELPDCSCHAKLLQKCAHYLPTTTWGRVALGASVLGVAGLGGVYLKNKLSAQKSEQPDAPETKRFVPGKKTAFFGLGALSVAGLTAAYLKGYVDVPEVDGKALADTAMSFCKDHWQALTGAAVGATAVGTGTYAAAVKTKKWWDTRTFMQALEAQINNNQKITMKWVKEHAPAIARLEDGTIRSGFRAYFKGTTRTKGLMTLVRVYLTATEDAAKIQAKREIDQKIEAIRDYLSQQ